MQSSHKKYDTIVVGSGPGGATVAKELTEKKQRILILEWGKYLNLKGSPLQAFDALGKPGKSLLFADKTFLPMMRGVCVGGSSVFYCATAFDPPYDMLDAYGIDVRKETEEVKKEVPVAPFKDELIGPGARVVMKSALDLGYDWRKLNKFVFQDKCKKECELCSYGCPEDAKWTAKNYIDTAVSGGAELITEAKVNKIIYENNSAVGVGYRRKFRDYTVHADRIVISAGGIGTPHLLRQNGFPEAGYDFFYDPLIIVFGALEGFRYAGETQMAAGIHLKEDGCVLTDLHFPAIIYAAQIAPRLKLSRFFTHGKTLSIMVKVKDDLGGRLTSGGGIRKSLAEGDRAKLQKGYEHAKRILENAGAKNVFSGWNLAAHPGGTVKINHLLDKNLKTEKDNLYVCDCSVIPEGWGIPPTLTLLALGKRLAGHLAG